MRKSIGQAPTGGEQTTKTVSDVFRHRSRTGKSYCWTRSDVGSERVKKPTITETLRLNRLRWFGHVQRLEGNRIRKKVIYMNLETTRLIGKPRNRWENGVREDGRLVGGEGWKERVYNREKWKNLLGTARNRHILHMPME
jgi:hypothetical protein